LFISDPSGHEDRIKCRFNPLGGDCELSRRGYNLCVR
jgi:hypothetical protein